MGNRGVRRCGGFVIGLGFMLDYLGEGLKDQGFVLDQGLLESGSNFMIGYRNNFYLGGGRNGMNGLNL